MPSPRRPRTAATAADRAVSAARRHCAEADAQLTPLRERVLRLLLTHGGPARAYELLTQMQTEQPGTAPMTVYRALDFLVEQGLAHKIDSTSSFVACIHGHHGPQAPAFVVCERCGDTREADAAAIGRPLGDVLGDFAPHSIEIKGVCGRCSGASAR